IGLSQIKRKGEASQTAAYDQGIKIELWHLIVIILVFCGIENDNRPGRRLYTCLVLLFRSGRPGGARR
ncbi:MAG TPA: hypothetical protein VFS89_05485, partial [Nitrosospira sp.]|nr:hypothetical protein [Nitrosospira sp.]